MSQNGFNVARMSSSEAEMCLEDGRASLKSRIIKMSIEKCRQSIKKLQRRVFVVDSFPLVRPLALCPALSPSASVPTTRQQSISIELINQ